MKLSHVCQFMSLSPPKPRCMKPAQVVMFFSCVCGSSCKPTPVVVCHEHFDLTAADYTAPLLGFVPYRPVDWAPDLSWRGGAA